MGRKRTKNVLPTEIHQGSSKPITAYPQDQNLTEKKLIFEDHLLENIKLENITIADVKRITSKTFDFLRTTGLRQTHISAITGINQSILSIILRDPNTKTISINRKRDVVFKLCEYYNKINLGLISRDPLTAPKISNSKKCGEINQKKRILPRRNLSEDELNNLTNFENTDNLFFGQSNYTELEKKHCEDQEYLAKPDGGTFNLEDSRAKSTDISYFNKSLKKNILFFSSCVGCSTETKKARKTRKFFVEDFCGGPLSPLINDNISLECTEFNCLYELNVSQLNYFNNHNFTSRILEPILLPLSVNLRHFISNSSAENWVIDNTSTSLVPKSNTTAIISTLRGINFKPEKFIWSSVSDSTSLWSFIESLSRERHLSTFMSNTEKKKAFNWLMKEIENYKSLYLQFLYLISGSSIKPGNDSLLICEIRISESIDDIVVNDKFRWNISNPTSSLKEQIECLISDLNLPQELFSDIFYSALKQVFDEIANFVKKFQHKSNSDIKADPIYYVPYFSDQYEDDTSSNSSFGANCETCTNEENAVKRLKRPVSYGDFVKWGNCADLEYDSDDNAKLFPIIENAEEKRQLENKNRFRKRR